MATKKRKPSKRVLSERARQGWETRRKNAAKAERAAKARKRAKEAARKPKAKARPVAKKPKAKARPVAKKPAPIARKPKSKASKKHNQHFTKALKTSKKVILELERRKREIERLEKEVKRLKKKGKRRISTQDSKFLLEREKERRKAYELGMLAYIQWLLDDAAERGISLEAAYITVADITGEEAREVFSIGRGSPSLKWSH